MSIKRFALILSAILVITVVIGQFAKNSFIDMGISSIRTVQDIENLDCQIELILDDAMIAAVKENLTYEDSDNAPVALIVMPTNHIRQYNNINIQEVTVVKSLKGNIPEGTKINVVHVGGVVHYDFGEQKNISIPLFSDVTNMMRPDNEYLICLEPNALNEYIPDNYYDIVGMNIFQYFNLATDDNIYFEKKSGVYKLNEFADSEFFTDTQEHYDELLKIKRQFIERYIN